VGRVNRKTHYQTPVAAGPRIRDTDNPSPDKGRSEALDHRALGRGQWNTYLVVAVDGVIKMSVNGRFVNGLSKSSQRKGYICMESEGAEIHFRNIQIMELPPGMTTPEQTAKPL
jgi:hypothetical protein